MEDLIEFYRTRLDGHEAEILEGWDSDGKAQVAVMWTGPDPGYTTVASSHVRDVWIADGREVDDARRVRVVWDPQVEVADITAKRAVLELHEPYDSEKHGGPACWTCGPGGFPYPCATLRALVQPFAGHPDFRDEWRLS